MSRLIDADVLKKHFEEIQKLECAIGLDFVAIIDEIKEQATAYDVDKVVERLEEFRPEMYKFGCGGILTDIIEVVKGGGVNA